MDALAYLEQHEKAQLRPVYVLLGDEDFLKRRCREALIAKAVGEHEPDFAVTFQQGEHLDFSTVVNDLDTVAFLAPRRVVVVESADVFVTAHRERLERYVTKPSKQGVLILDVKTFPETTKLAKALPDGAKLACKAPTTNKLPDWCSRWAKTNYSKTLPGEAAEMLVELVGPAMGLLDMEIGKLAVAVGSANTLTVEQIRTHVTRTSEANVFHIMDAIGDGKPQLALTLLHRLMQDGEAELAVLGALSYQLRKLAGVNRQLKLGQSLGQAMDAAGVPKWPQARQSAEKQLRALGRRRLDQLTDWLVDVNLGLKGGSALPMPVQMERLIVRLASPRPA
jgi:DNA polymerase-3 subunit delta